MDLEPYLATLRDLAPIRSVAVTSARTARGPGDAQVHVRTARGTHRLAVERQEGRLTEIAAAAVRHPGIDLVVAPVIAGAAAHRLATRGINYVDRAGNCHLRLGSDVYIHVEGRRAPRPAPLDRGLRAAAYQVLFTYLAGADLDAPVRRVGALAGVSHQAALEARERMRADGFIEQARGKLRWRARGHDGALRRWLEGYPAAVRPRLRLGSYRARVRTPPEVDALIETTLGPPGERWRWGGTAAGYALHRYYRGERTVVHVRDDAVADELVRRAPLVADREGPVVLLRAFGTATWPAEPAATVAPLLAYSEMLVGDDVRAGDAAAELFEAIIAPGWMS